MRFPRLTATLLAAVLLIATAGARASTVDQAAAYQLDPAHDGNMTATALTTPLSQLWSKSFSGAVSYPLVVDGFVYVTTADASNTLTALNAATGATVWSHQLGGTYHFTGIAYDAGRIFALNDSGLLTAFDASSGSTDWSTRLGSDTSFTAPPTPADGLLFASGSGAVFAVRQSTGATVWTGSVENGDESSPAVSGSSVYVTYACSQDYDFDAISGNLVWHDSTGCEGGGGKTPVVANGDVFGRDSGGDEILSAADGSTVGTFSSGPAPAVGGGVAYTLQGGTLSAISNSGTGSVAWTFAGDGMLDSAPLIVGNLIFVGSQSGEIYALNAAGTVQWSTNVGSAINAPDEQNDTVRTGLGAGGGELLIPATDSLVAYAPTSAVGITPVNTTAPHIDGTVRADAPVAADVGVWTGVPDSYTYQWQLCDAAGASCTNISQATAAVYTPTDTQIGSTLAVTVTAVSASASATVTSAPSSAVIEATPVDQSPPTISGTTVQGSTLTVTPGTWSPTPQSFDYQWLRCSAQCAAIAGATGQTYTLTADDVNDTLEVSVTPVDAGGRSPATDTAMTAQITGAVPPTNNTAPSVSGTPVYPGTLTAQTGSWSGTPTSYDYQWFDCQPPPTTGPPESSPTGCVGISGASGATYALAESDVGHVIVVGVTAHNAFGASAENDSNGTAVVTTQVPLSTSPPTFSGELVSGQGLTATDGAWSNSPTAFAFQWVRCKLGTTSCAAIPGATASTYLLTTADVGSSIIVVVTASNGHGTSQPVTSSAEGPVAAAIGPITSPSIAPRPTVTERAVTGKLSSLLKVGLPVVIDCSDHCLVDLVLTAPIGSHHRTVTLGHVDTILAAAKSQILDIRLSAKTARTIRKLHPRSLVITLKTTLTHADGTTYSATKRYTIRR